MADTPNLDNGAPATASAYPGTPHWVKVFGITALILIVLVIVVLVVTTALGLHTPGGPGGHLALFRSHG